MVELIDTGYFAGENYECVITAVLNYLTARKFSASYIEQVKERFEKHPKNLKPGVHIGWTSKVLEDILDGEFEVNVSIEAEIDLDKFPEETRNKFRKVSKLFELPVPDTAIILAKTIRNTLHSDVFHFNGESYCIIDSDGVVYLESHYEPIGQINLKQKNGGQK